MSDNPFEANVDVCAKVTPEHIHESNLIEGFDLRNMDVCGEAAWAWLDTHDAITPDVVLDLHRIVVACQINERQPTKQLPWIGAWRTVYVRVGGYQAPHWDQVPELIEQWCTYGLEQPPRAAHVEFERIHPFVDGNGRTGRLLLWWHQTRIGQQPILIRAAERHDYYAWFQPHHETVEAT